MFSGVGFKRVHNISGELGSKNMCPYWNFFMPKFREVPEPNPPKFDASICVYIYKYTNLVLSSLPSIILLLLLVAVNASSRGSCSLTHSWQVRKKTQTLIIIISCRPVTLVNPLARSAVILWRSNVPNSTSSAAA